MFKISILLIFGGGSVNIEYSGRINDANHIFDHFDRLGFLCDRKNGQTQKKMNQKQETHINDFLG